MATDTTTDTTRLPRRAVLAGGAVLAAAGVAGCAVTPVATPAPGAAPEAAGSAGTELGDAAEVPVGGGVIYPALEVVVTQTAAGEYAGFSAVCTHTGCIVDRIDAGEIVCPCHGSRFALDGSVVTGPAPRALDTRAVEVVDGRLVLG